MKNEKEKLDNIIKEDLLLFINACCTCTVQNEFYTDKSDQKMSISFLHEYMLVNYRVYYMQILALNINQFNKAMIIRNLLASGKVTPSELKTEENSLITKALYTLTNNRVYKLFENISNQKINNRRTRAVIKSYMEKRKDLSFDIVKYRSKVNSAVAHNHLSLKGEANEFLFKGYKSKRYKTELFENFRQAHFSKDAVFKLPYTVAEGFIKKHNINRSEFLEKIRSKMTFNEKLRAQEISSKSKVQMDIDLSKATLTKIAIYFLSLPYSERKKRYDEFDTAMNIAAKKVIKKWNFKQGKVAAVLDSSFSMSGSTEKKRRPLAVSLASEYLFKNASCEYKSFWTEKVNRSLLIRARGHTDLNIPLIEAFEFQPDKIIIVSDGYDNSFCKISEVIRVLKTRIDKENKVKIIHFNPVFDANELEPKKISDLVPTLGLRDSEDIPSIIPFGELEDSKESLYLLENFLTQCKENFIGYKNEN